MRIERIIHVVDTHTQGNPTRVVIGGFPYIPGKTMIEKMNYVKKYLDDLVNGIIWEPRGHDDMGAAIIVPPVSQEADLGVIFRGATEYLAMCGHETIGVVTAVIETGIVKMEEPITTVTLDTPAGIVVAKAKVKDGSVMNVTLRNVPSFLYMENCSVNVQGLGEIVGDIAFGGNFYFLVDTSKLGIDIETIEIDKLINIANKLREAVNKTYKVSHPLIPAINEINATVFIAPPSHPKADRKLIYIRGTHIDRSPCGTGTSAVMASFYTKGLLKKDVFISESILGTLYKGKIVGKTRIGEFNAIIPEITGKAWIHGFNTIMIDRTDPFKYGFRLRERIMKPIGIDPYSWISDDGEEDG